MENHCSAGGKIMPEDKLKVLDLFSGILSEASL